MEIRITKKCVTATNTFKKVGEVVNVRGADAEALVKAGNAEYTPTAEKQSEASKKVIKSRALAKLEAKETDNSKAGANEILKAQKELETLKADNVKLQKEFDALKAKEAKAK